MRAPSLLPASAIALCALIGGCDMTRLTANQTAGLFERGTPALEAHWDYDMVGDALPASILQLEGVFHVVPDNESIALQLMRAYASYAYGWIEEQAEVAEAAGEMERAEALRGRARRMYARARDVGIHAIGLSHEGFAQAKAAGVPQFEAWLHEEFDDAEDDTALLLWTGYAWGSWINVNREDMEAVADLPYASALVTRSVDLDPSYFNAAGLTFLGASSAEAIGADLEKAKRYFERALELTRREALVIQLNYARAYATKAGDKALYVRLLTEVLEAPDVAANRLANTIARRRAQRYLAEADQLFLE